MSDNDEGNCRCKKRFLGSQKPDSVWSFVVLLAGFVCTAIPNGCLYSFGVILPELMDTFGQSRAKTAIVGSLGQGVGYFFSPIASYLFERFGFRRTVMFSALLSVIGLSTSAISPILPLMYLTYGCLNGIGLSFIHNASVVVVMKHFVKWRSLSSGIVQSAFAFGLLAVSQGTRKMIGQYGWRWTLFGWAMLAATVFIFGAVFDGKEDKNTNHRSHQNNYQRGKFLTALSNRLLLLYSISFGLSYMAFYVPHIFLVKYSEEQLGIPRDKSTLLYMYFSAVSVVSRIIYCNISTSKYINRFILYQVSMMLTGIAIILLPYCKTYLHLVLFMSLMGLFDGGFWGLSALLVTDCAHDISNLNYAWGLFNCIISVAGVCGAPLAGLIADLTDSFIPSFYASGATLLVASSLMFLRGWTKGYSRPGIDCREEIRLCSKDELLYVGERETVL